MKKTITIQQLTSQYVPVTPASGASNVNGCRWDWEPKVAGLVGQNPVFIAWDNADGQTVTLEEVKDFAADRCYGIAAMNYLNLKDLHATRARAEADKAMQAALCEAQREELDEVARVMRQLHPALIAA